jgi:hypothetical protein
MSNDIQLCQLERERDRLRAALERAFIALGKLGGSYVNCSNQTARDAWLDARIALELVRK